jgi:hypothetical protein
MPALFPLYLVVAAWVEANQLEATQAETTR